MTYGFIITAGKQSRFGYSRPKALMSFSDGNTFLDINIDRLGNVCDKVFVVCSYDNHQWFSDNKIVIDSGKGCGDAVMKALRSVALQPEDTCFIQWGDCLIEDRVYQETKNYYTGSCVIPCVVESNPYVQIIESTPKHVNVLFSKYNERVSEGYHDLSVFYGNALDILTSLELFRKQIEVEDRYVHKHGNEMQFLDVFNETDLEAVIKVIDNYEPFSFNTVEELQTLLWLKEKKDNLSS